jgi:hypothetical protein
MFSFDLPFDGSRAVFCMKPENEKAYHLYEIVLDGKGFRQITSGAYSDIDPIYLPGGRYLFLSTRAEVASGGGEAPRGTGPGPCWSTSRSGSDARPWAEVPDTGRKLARAPCAAWSACDRSAIPCPL